MPNASVIRKAWGQSKPLPGAQIDRGHPLARELSVCALDYTDLVSGAPARPQAAIVSAGPGGPGWRLSGQATQGISFAVPTGTISTNTRPFTLRAVYTTQTWVNLANIAGFGNLVTSINGGGPATRSIMNSGAATTYNYWDDNVNVGFTGTSVATIGVTDVIYTYDGTNLRCYSNGAQVGAATALNGLTFTSTDLFWIGGRHAAGSTTITGWVYAANYWNRKLTFDEIEWLAVEPYAFLAPPGPRAIYYIGTTGVIAKTGTAYAALGAVMLDPGKKANTGATRALAGTADLTTAKKGGLGATTGITGLVVPTSAKKATTGATTATAGTVALTSAKKGVLGAVAAALGAIGKTTTAKKIIGAVRAVLGAFRGPSAPAGVPLPYLSTAFAVEAHTSTFTVRAHRSTDLEVS